MGSYLQFRKYIRRVDLVGINSGRLLAAITSLHHSTPFQHLLTQTSTEIRGKARHNIHTFLLISRWISILSVKDEAPIRTLASPQVAKSPLHPRIDHPGAWGAQWNLYYEVLLKTTIAYLPKTMPLNILEVPQFDQSVANGYQVLCDVACYPIHTDAHKQLIRQLGELLYYLLGLRGNTVGAQYVREFLDRP